MTTPSKGETIVCSLSACSRQGELGLGDSLLLLGFLGLGDGDLEFALGLGHVLGRDHSGLAIVEPLVAGHRGGGNVGGSLPLLDGSSHLGLDLGLLYRQLGGFSVQVADGVVLEGGGAKLELHPVDHPFAKRGDRGFFDPVDRGQFVENQSGHLRTGGGRLVLPVLGERGDGERCQQASGHGEGGLGDGHGGKVLQVSRAVQVSSGNDWLWDKIPILSRLYV